MVIWGSVHNASILARIIIQVTHTRFVEVAPTNHVGLDLRGKMIDLVALSDLWPEAAEQTRKAPLELVSSVINCGEP